MVTSEHRLSSNELVVIVAAALLLLTATASYAIPRVTGQQTLESATSIKAFIEMARLEAINRNRECRLRLDVADGRIRALTVLDTLGTSDDPSDDRVLHEKPLFPSPNIAPPRDESMPPALGRLVRFGPDGAAFGGAAQLILGDRPQQGRILVYENGVVEVQRRADGGGWTPLG